MEVGHRGRGCAVRPVVHRLRRAPRERAVRPRRVGQGKGVDGEVRRHTEVGGHVHVGARVGRRAVAPIHEVVMEVGHRGRGCAVRPVVHRLRRAPRERAVRPRCVGQGKGVDGEVRRHSAVSRDRAGGVGVGHERPAATRNRVNVVACVGRDREGRRSVEGHSLRCGRREAAVSSRRRRDRERCVDRVGLAARGRHRGEDDGVDGGARTSHASHGDASADSCHAAAVKRNPVLVERHVRIVAVV